MCAQCSLCPFVFAPSYATVCVCVQLWQFLGVAPEPKACFYTAGLDEIPKMVEGTRYALAMTPHLKIKLDSDVEKSTSHWHYVLYCISISKSALLSMLHL